VRTYRVSRAETLSEGVGSGKSSFCAKYFIKFFVADLVRPATFGGRTYPAVLESTYYPIPPLVPRPTYAKRVFFTKAEGLLRVEEFGGTMWNQL